MFFSFITLILVICCVLQRVDAACKEIKTVEECVANQCGQSGCKSDVSFCFCYQFTCCVFVISGFVWCSHVSSSSKQILRWLVVLNHPIVVAKLRPSHWGMQCPFVFICNTILTFDCVWQYRCRCACQSYCYANNVIVSYFAIYFSLFSMYSRVDWHVYYQL